MADTDLSAGLGDGGYATAYKQTPPGYQQAPDGDFLENILIAAINNRASDIHFDAQREGMSIRLRIDGLLHPYIQIQKLSQDTIISRIKVLAKLNITEHRFPQDGHIEFNHNGETFNFRVSTFPTIFGESTVLRVVNREEVLMKLDDLGFDQQQLALIKMLSTSTSGMILATGPTGSGKTQLLYSIIQSLNKPEKNIITVEDPIELQMSNVRQAQINEVAGLTFEKALRSVVRQDPDVIMLGEIRDSEAAQMAIQASLIGILVLSTFHTFDIPALVTRLFEMGISNSITAQAIKGVVSARLVRKICNDCKAPYQLTEFENNMLQDYTIASFQKGTGCTMCNNTGYLGRIGLFEIVEFDDDIRSVIIEKKPSALYELLASKKIKSLKDCAIDKVSAGVTTFDEVVRILGILPFRKADATPIPHT